jgi:hypothetical protein
VNDPNNKIGYSFAVAQEDFAKAKQILDTEYPGQCQEYPFSKHLCPKVTIGGKEL